ncbi:MAG: hypothetical protein Q8N96_00040 [Methylovulum sp.]|nr:hypothetical protein [Methylovulum sp.]
MPSNSDLNAISRQWEILKLLVRTKSPGIEAKVVVEQWHDLGFDIKKRTVERDLKALEQIFKINCNDKGTPCGWGSFSILANILAVRA